MSWWKPSYRNSKSTIIIKKKNWNIQTSSDYFFDFDLIKKAKKESELFKKYTSTEEMNAEQFF